jgi:hypothetical protein
VVAVDVAHAGRWLADLATLRVTRLLRARGLAIPPLGPLRVVREPTPYGSVPAPPSALPPAHHRTTPALDAGTPPAAPPGLELDPVYAAKAWAHFVADGRPGLFVATSNARPLAPLLATALDRLPPRLDALLVEPRPEPRG